MKFTAAFALVFLMVLGLAPRVHAALIYTLRFDQTAYLATKGGTVDVELLLREEATGATSNVINTTGVQTADVTVNWTGNSTVANAGDITVGAGFIGGGSVTATSASVTNFSVAGVTGSLVSTGIYEVSLGVFKFTIPSTSDTTSIVFADISANPPANIVLTDATVLDGSISSFGGASITNPEPGTFVLGGLGSLALLGFHWGRRRRRQAGERQDADTAPPVGGGPTRRRQTRGHIR